MFWVKTTETPLLAPELSIPSHFPCKVHRALQTGPNSPSVFTTLIRGWSGTIPVVMKGEGKTSESSSSLAWFFFCAFFLLESYFQGCFLCLIKERVKFHWNTFLGTQGSEDLVWLALFDIKEAVAILWAPYWCPNTSPYILYSSHRTEETYYIPFYLFPSLMNKTMRNLNSQPGQSNPPFSDHVLRLGGADSHSDLFTLG